MAFSPSSSSALRGGSSERCVSPSTPAPSPQSRRTNKQLGAKGGSPTHTTVFFPAETVIQLLPLYLLPPFLHMNSNVWHMRIQLGKTKVVGLCCITLGLGPGKGEDTLSPSLHRHKGVEACVSSFGRYLYVTTGCLGSEKCGRNALAPYVCIIRKSCVGLCHHDIG